MKCINCIQLAFQLSLQFNWQHAIANWKFKANNRCSTCCCCCVVVVAIVVCVAVVAAAIFIVAFGCWLCLLLCLPSWRPMLPNAAEVIDTNVSMCLHMLSICLSLCPSLPLALPLYCCVCLRRAAAEKRELNCRTAAALNWKYSTNRSNVQFAHTQTQAHPHTHRHTHSHRLHPPWLKCNGRHFEFNCGQR